MTHSIPFDREVSRYLYLAAPIAALLFTCSVVGFAALRKDGYTHGTKAVSELGAVDAPMAVAFNTLALILPGLLIVVFALALIKDFRRRAGPLMLAAAGVFLTLSGLAPADMDNMRAITTLLHVIGAIGAGVLWTLSLFWLGPMLRELSSLNRWGAVTPWFSLFMLVHIGWQVVFNIVGSGLPGWGQRFGFLGFFLWPAVTGLLLWKLQEPAKRPA